MFFIKDLFLKNKIILKSQAIPTTGLINISGPHKRKVFALLAGKTQSAGMESAFVSIAKDRVPSVFEFDLSFRFSHRKKTSKKSAGANEILHSYGFEGDSEKPFFLQSAKNQIALLKFHISEAKPDFILIDFLKPKNSKHYFEIMNALYTLPGNRGIILLVPDFLEKTIGFLAEIRTMDVLQDSALQKSPSLLNTGIGKFLAWKPIARCRSFFSNKIAVNFTGRKKDLYVSYLKSEWKKIFVLFVLSISASMFLDLSVVTANDTRGSILSAETLKAASLNEDQKILGKITSTNYPSDSFVKIDDLVSETQTSYGFRAIDFETRMYFVSTPSANFSPMLLPNPLNTLETLPAHVVSIPYISRYVSYLGIYLLNEPAWDNMNGLDNPVYISRPYANLYLAHLGLTRYSDLTGMTFDSLVNDGSSPQNQTFTIAGVVLTPENYYSTTLSFYDHLLGDYYVFTPSSLNPLFGGKSVYFEVGVKKNETREVLMSIQDFTKENKEYDFSFLERNSDGDFSEGSLEHFKEATYSFFDSTLSKFISSVFAFGFLLVLAALLFSMHFSNESLRLENSSLLDETAVVVNTVVNVFLAVPLAALFFRLINLRVNKIVHIPLSDPLALLLCALFFLFVFLLQSGPIFFRKERGHGK